MSKIVFQQHRSEADMGNGAALTSASGQKRKGSDWAKLSPLLPQQRTLTSCFGTSAKGPKAEKHDLARDPFTNLHDSQNDSFRNILIAAPASAVLRGEWLSPWPVEVGRRAADKTWKHSVRFEQ
jgi:hypothetical protein